MTAMPIYGKNPLKIFSRTRRSVTLGLGIKHLGCGAYQVCSNYDPKLTLTYLTSRSNLLPNAIKWEFFSEIYFLMLLKRKSLFSLDMLNLMTGAQWLSGRVLDSRPKGCGFVPHCVVVLEQDTFILAQYWFYPGRQVPL